MEARRGFEGASISKSFVAAVLVIVALGLGVMGAFVAKGLTGSAAGSGAQVQQVHITPATSLRQDNDYPKLPAAPQRTLRIQHS